MIEKALLLLEKHEHWHTMKREMLRADLDIGIRQMENGEYTQIREDELDDFFENLIADAAHNFNSKQSV